MALDKVLQRVKPLFRNKTDWAPIRHRGRLMLVRMLVYLFVFNICFVFFFPVLFMVAQSLQTIGDVTDPTVYWVPREALQNGINWELLISNYSLAAKALNYWPSTLNSFIVAFSAAIGQLISAALVGYGFARCRFPGREFLFMLALFTFIVPPQVLIIPKYILYSNLDFLDSFRPFIWPAFFGQGLNGALFIFIFRQFFRGQPWEIEDAARIDGAGALRTFAQIMLPMAKPAMLVTLLFSFVWHWNDYFEPSIYLRSMGLFTLPIRLKNFWGTLSDITGGQSQVQEFYNEPLVLAGAFLVVLVPLVVYLIMQRHFVQSIERTGLVE